MQDSYGESYTYGFIKVVDMCMRYVYESLSPYNAGW